MDAIFLVCCCSRLSDYLLLIFNPCSGTNGTIADTSSIWAPRQACSVAKYCCSAASFRLRMRPKKSISRRRCRIHTVLLADNPLHHGYGGLRRLPKKYSQRRPPGSADFIANSRDHGQQLGPAQALLRPGPLHVERGDAQVAVVRQRRLYQLCSFSSVMNSRHSGSASRGRRRRSPGFRMARPWATRRERRFGRVLRGEGSASGRKRHPGQRSPGPVRFLGTSLPLL